MAPFTSLLRCEEFGASTVFSNLYVYKSIKHTCVCHVYEHNLGVCVSVCVWWIHPELNIIFEPGHMHNSFYNLFHSYQVYLDLRVFVLLSLWICDHPNIAQIHFSFVIPWSVILRGICARTCKLILPLSPLPS